MQQVTYSSLSLEKAVAHLSGIGRVGTVIPAMKALPLASAWAPKLHLFKTRVCLLQH